MGREFAATAVASVLHGFGFAFVEDVENDVLKLRSVVEPDSPIVVAKAGKELG